MNHNYYRFTNISNHLKKNNNVTIYLTNYYIKINQLSEHIPVQFFFSKKKTKEINRIHLDPPFSLQPSNKYPSILSGRERESSFGAQERRHRSVSPRQDLDSRFRVEGRRAGRGTPWRRRAP